MAGVTCFDSERLNKLKLGDIFDVQGVKCSAGRASRLTPPTGLEMSQFEPSGGKRRRIAGK